MEKMGQGLLDIRLHLELLLREYLLGRVGMSTDGYSEPMEMSTQVQRQSNIGTAA